jgi:pyridoxal phosphate enzyme (YggS family)
MIVVNNFIKIKKEIELISDKTDIIAVSKNFSLDKIRPLIDFGHLHFGENRVNEATDKWSEVLKTNTSLKIHLIGRLQSNKVKDVFKVFSYVHSLDNIKLAEKLANEEILQKKKIKYFIQLNLANEPQKSGILFNDFDVFYSKCTKDLKLDVIGLMCIPPVHSNPEIYFKKLNEISIQYNLNHLSMGMSSDYMQAIKYGSTFIRVGTGIFGPRVKI